MRLPSDVPQTDGFDAAGWAAMVPAWLLSLAAHLLLAVVGSLAIRGFNASQPRDDEAIRPAEIVLVRREANRNEYFADEQPESRHTVLRPQSTEIAVGAKVGSGGSGGVDQPPVLAGVTLPQLPGGAATSEGLVVAPQLGGRRG